MNKKRYLLAVALLLAVMGLAACGGAGESDAAPNAPAVGGDRDLKRRRAPMLVQPVKGPIPATRPAAPGIPRAAMPAARRARPPTWARAVTAHRGAAAATKPAARPHPRATPAPRRKATILAMPRAAPATPAPSLTRAPSPARALSPARAPSPVRAPPRIRMQAAHRAARAPTPPSPRAECTESPEPVDPGSWCGRQPRNRTGLVPGSERRRGESCQLSIVGDRRGVPQPGGGRPAHRQGPERQRLDSGPAVCGRLAHRHDRRHAA